MTELTKPLVRRAGNLVVKISRKGVTLRRYRCHRYVTVSWEEIAKRGLENASYCCNDQEWRAPAKTLAKLRRIPRSSVFHGRRSPSDELPTPISTAIARDDNLR